MKSFGLRKKFGKKKIRGVGIKKQSKMSTTSKALLFLTFLFFISILLFKTMFVKKIVYFNVLRQENMVEIDKEEEINKLFEDLVMCESSNNELAINRKDSDGTASFGLLQWKPETFRRLAIKYGVIGEKADWNWIMTLVFDRKVNKKIFAEVMRDKTENPYLLWPICCKKIGCKRFNN